VELVLRVGRLEVERDGGALRRVVGLLQRVRGLAAGRPAGPLALTGAPGHQRHLVRHHEAGVEADAELADEPLGTARVLGLPQLLQEGGRTGVGDGADELSDLVVRHPDAVVPHREGPGLLVDVDLDVQVGHIGVERVVPQLLQAQLVQRVGGVGDELPQEDILVRVDRVDHQLEQLTRLYLELKRFGRHGSRIPHRSHSRLKLVQSL
jgi:hypothetical protein